MKTKIHTLIFDLDDTLYLERDFAISGYQAIQREFSQVLPHNFLDLALIFFDKRVKNIFNEFTSCTTLLTKMIEIYRSHNPSISLSTENLTLLKELSSKVNLGLISDGVYQTQERKFKSLGLDTFIDSPFFTDIKGRAYWKPNPYFFEEYMSLFPNKESRGYVYIGDNETKDFLAPNNLGWTTIKISQKQSVHCDKKAPSVDHKALFHVQSLEEIKEIITW